MQRDESLARSNGIDGICVQFEKSCLAGDAPAIEDVLAENAGVDRSRLLRELLLIELEIRRTSGETPSAGEYASRFPEQTDVIDAALETFATRVPDPNEGETVDVSFHSADETYVPSDPAEAETILPGSGTEPAQPSSSEPGGKRFGDYELLHEIARGGMGVVYKARQVKLNRVVALKMIKSGELAGDEEIQRFHTEAEAAAALDHPNIVPIYEVGEWRAGGVSPPEHFFSMGFIEGAGLDSRLKEGPLPPKEAAELIKSIAEAVQYAHDKGIVHRDLKPANVLIDTDGKSKITDFGLAKNIAGDSGVTATGQVMGTPSYMPPEQAAGKVEEIGPLADVYSLGAMLYATLTGRPPFQSANVMETLKQVLEREPVSPSQLNPAVDKDLETICLKCLEKDAAKRYPTARDFANDLECYLTGKPISARPISRPARLWRWCKRNPLGATVAGLLLFLAIAGPAVAIHQIETNRQLDNALAGEKIATATAQQKERETATALAKVKVALASEQAALKRKDTALLETEKSIDAYVEVVKNAKLLKEPRFKPLLKDLLKDALAHYTRFIKEHKDEQDETTQGRLARSQFELGLLSARMGSHQEAIEASLQALFLYENLAQDHPAARYQRRLAQCHFNLGVLYDQVGQRDKAGKSLKNALRIWQRLSHAFPTVCDYRSELVNNQTQLAVHQAEVGETEEARKLFQQSSNTLETLVTQEPNEPLHRSRLARCQYNLGILLSDIHQHSAALSALRSSIMLQKDLAGRYPSVASYQSGLADAFNSLGVLQFDLGAWDKALNSYHAAESILRRLRELNPNVRTYQSDLARCRVNLANICRETGREAEALAASRDNLSILRKLVAENPKIVNYQSELAAGELNDGLIQRRFGHQQAALKSCQRAVELYERLTRRNPEVLNHANQLSRSRINLGILFHETNQDKKAKPCFQLALETYSRLARRQPRNHEYQVGAANCHDNLAILLHSADKLAEAAESAERATAIYEKLLMQHPDDASSRDGLAKCWNNLAVIHRDAGHQQAAEECMQKALRMHQQLVRQHPPILEYQVSLAGIYTAIAEWRQESQRFSEALNLCRQAEVIYEKLVCQHPRIGSYLRKLAECDNNIGFLSRAIGRRDDARVYWQQAVQLRERLVQMHPMVTDFQSELAGSYGDLGLIYGEIGNREESLESYRNAIVVYEQLAQDDPNESDHRINLARTHINVAVSLARSGESAKVLKSFEQCVKLLKPILSRRPRDAQVRMFLHTAHRGRAITADKMRRYAFAAREWNSALQLSPPNLRFTCAFKLAASLARSGDHIQATRLSGLLAKQSKSDASAYELSRLFAISTAKVKQDEHLSAEKRMQLSTQYVSKMMALLTRIKREGFFQSPQNRNALAKESDFQSLYENGEFRAFATSLGIALPMPAKMPKP